jgi:hypothetical protein
MMPAGAPAREEAGDGALGSPGLQELDLAHERDVHALAGDLLHGGTGLAGEEFNEGSGRPEGRDGDADVVERIGRHDGRLHSGSGFTHGWGAGWHRETQRPSSGSW